MKDNPFWQPTIYNATHNATKQQPLTAEQLDKMKRNPPKCFADENYNEMIDMVIKVLFDDEQENVIGNN